MEDVSRFGCGADWAGVCGRSTECVAGLEVAMDWLFISSVASLTDVGTRFSRIAPLLVAEAAEEDSG